jgi:hypothetical protein
MLKRRTVLLYAICLVCFIERVLIMYYNVNDWVEFDYVDAKGEYKHWKGEVVEVCHWGYRINTQDGYRSFRFKRMRNDKQLV